MNSADNPFGGDWWPGSGKCLILVIFKVICLILGSRNMGGGGGTDELRASDWDWGYGRPWRGSVATNPKITIVVAGWFVPALSGSPWHGRLPTFRNAGKRATGDYEDFSSMGIYSMFTGKRRPGLGHNSTCDRLGPNANRAFLSAATMANPKGGTPTQGLPPIRSCGRSDEPESVERDRLGLFRQSRSISHRCGLDPSEGRGASSPLRFQEVGRPGFPLRTSQILGG